MGKVTYLGIGQDITAGCNYCTQCELLDGDFVHKLFICKCKKGKHPENCIYCLSHLKKTGEKQFMQDVKTKYLEDGKEEEFYRDPTKEDLKYLIGKKHFGIS